MTTNSAQLDFALDAITLDQAKAYAADTEKWTHVTDNYLDVWGFKRTSQNVERVEARFDELLANAAK